METNTVEFNQIYKENHQNVYRLALSYVAGNESMAEELTQEVFVKVWQNLDRFRGDAKASTWIYRITVNTCLMHLRKLKKENVNISQEISEDITEEASDEKEAKLTWLRACIKSLDEIGKLLMTLVLEEVPQKEIAEITGISNENVRVKVHRTKGKIFKCMTLKAKQHNNN
ncbi:RNA polymerase sigma factor [Prolixibacteraceae bacterium JC049]|nr:RNA polymerase sigma factor [Prolixibacteraceae bacterium JC049]